MNSISKYLFEHLHFGIEDKEFTFIEKAIFLIIILNCIIVVVESEQEIYFKYKYYFDFSRIFFGIVFTIEYVGDCYL